MTNQEDLPNLALPRCCFLLLKHSGPAQACKGPRGEGQPSQVSDSLNPGIRCHISGTVEEPRPATSRCASYPDCRIPRWWPISCTCAPASLIRNKGTA